MPITAHDPARMRVPFVINAAHGLDRLTGDRSQPLQGQPAPTPRRRLRKALNVHDSHGSTERYALRLS